MALSSSFSYHHLPTLSTNSYGVTHILPSPTKQKQQQQQQQAAIASNNPSLYQHSTT
eukprot:GDKH01018853.1.p2 GENE.GDKH01018853.1~~GDKH01018853.1.p2  ORF type:complete len:57 (+),score=1.38 GDKH01018853.1:42-212(+)